MMRSGAFRKPLCSAKRIYVLLREQEVQQEGTPGKNQPSLGGCQISKGSNPIPGIR